MAYLFFNDYKKAIQVDNLMQIVGNDTSMITATELDAVEEFKSYLVQKYDVNKEFTDTLKYQFNVTRYAKDRIYLDADVYSSASRYAVNDQVLYGGDVYICITAIDPPEPFDISKWQLLGNQYDIFFVKTPQPDWNYYSNYVKNNIVFFENKTYTCLIPNSAMNPSLNPLYWGSGNNYNVNGTILPTDSNYFIAGDNRSQQTVSSIVDIVLYNLHTRIAPRNIPDLRVKRYDDTIKWLKNVSRGDDVTANIPKIQPNIGMRNRFGSAIPKQNNNF